MKISYLWSLGVLSTRRKEQNGPNTICNRTIKSSISQSSQPSHQVGQGHYQRHDIPRMKWNLSIRTEMSQVFTRNWQITKWSAQKCRTVGSVGLHRVGLVACVCLSANHSKNIWKFQALLRLTTQWFDQMLRELFKSMMFLCCNAETIKMQTCKAWIPS